MELAIPLIALGSMYMASRSSSEATNVMPSPSPKTPSPASKTQNKLPSIKEGFTTIPTVASNLDVYSASKKIDTHTDTDSIQSYTFKGNNVTSRDNLYDYPTQEEDTNKYFNQTAYESNINAGRLPGSNIHTINSLSGNILSSKEFTHHNMVPFMGGKVAGPLYDDKYAENILDNMNGTGSRHIKKTEQRPLFDPSENMQHPHGTPNSSDFYQSRVNPGMSMNNTKPWDSIHVGPGLDGGYSSSGTGGFNSGMNSREKWLPKTVDELRVETKPKMEYSLVGHEGPIQSVIKEVGLLGSVDRKLPDSFFVNSPDRWFTTTGTQKGETLRAEQPTGIIKRVNDDTNYVGPAGNIVMPTVGSKDNYEPSKREPSKPQALLGATSTSKGNTSTHQNKVNNYVPTTNNRQEANKSARVYGNTFGGMLGSVVAPIVNMLRPTRKEELVNNVRIYGYPNSAVPAEQIVPTDKPKITNKETTLYTPRAYINNQRESATYVNNNLDLPINNRNQSNTYNTGFAGGPSTSYGGMSLESAYNQTSNNIKSQTISNRTAIGNMSIFNNNMNICMSKPDANQQDSRLGPASSIIKMSPSTDTYGHVVLPNKTSITENDSKYNQTRMDPSMLKAFYNNPYTHGLNSVA